MPMFAHTQGSLGTFCFCLVDRVSLFSCAYVRRLPAWSLIGRAGSGLASGRWCSRRLLPRRTADSSAYISMCVSTCVSVCGELIRITVPTEVHLPWVRLCLHMLVVCSFLQDAGTTWSPKKPEPSAQSTIRGVESWRLARTTTTVSWAPRYAPPWFPSFTDCLCLCVPVHVCLYVYVRMCLCVSVFCLYVRGSLSPNILSDHTHGHGLLHGCAHLCFFGVQGMSRS